MMRGLTLLQPYGTLKVKGIKQYETRSWATNYRGTVAIHAGAKLTRYMLYRISDVAVLEHIITALIECGAIPSDVHFGVALSMFLNGEILPTGAVLGYGNLVACHRIDQAFIERLSERERALGYFIPGRYAWEFEDIVELKHPLKMRGAQQLWTVKNEDEIYLRGDSCVKAAAH